MKLRIIKPKVECMSNKEIAKMREYWRGQGMGIPSVDTILNLLDEIERLKQALGESK